MKLKRWCGKARNVRAPHDPYNADGLPLVAERRGDTENAKKFPTYWKGYVQGAICLVKVGQLDAAEALIETALNDLRA
jgi:hypothetical protein